MPEMPEVETVRRTLEPLLVGERIIDVDVYHQNMIETPDTWKDIIGQEIQSIGRIGKYLLFHFESVVMISHLRMEGKYFYVEPRKKHPHEHVIFHLSSGKDLIYHDVRKFGKFRVHMLETYTQEPPLSLIGPEPKDSDARALKKKLSTKSIPIKQALLDQHIIAGLGNIYVDETLFRAGIHPLTPSNTLNEKQLNAIITHATNVLNKAVQLGGSTIRSYYATIGVDGKFQNELQVHTKKDEPCPVCNTQIIKMKVGGRGTYVCPKCQKKKNYRSYR